MVAFIYQAAIIPASAAQLVVHSSFNRPRPNFFVWNTTPICEGPLFPVRGLKLQKALLLYMMEGDLAVYIGGAANVCIDYWVYFESLGSLRIFAILGSVLSVGDARKGVVPAF